MKHYRLKTLLQGAVVVATALSALYAGPVIPEGCSTPGTCEEIKPVLRNATLSDTLVLKDKNSSNTITIETSDLGTEDVKLILPRGKHKAGDILVMDENGQLKWESGPDNDRLLGQITFMHPDPSKHIYEINGSTVTDPKLAQFLRDNPIIGFYTSGDSVQMPDWRGRYLGGHGDHDIPAAAGLEIDSSVKEHQHRRYTVGDNKSIQDNTSLANNGNWFPSENSTTRTSSKSGGNYSRPETVAMPIVIIGGN